MPLLKLVKSEYNRYGSQGTVTPRSRLQRLEAHCKDWRRLVWCRCRCGLDMCPYHFCFVLEESTVRKASCRIHKRQQLSGMQRGICG